ncbi:MAG: hypothetical protein ACTSVI_06285 [Promethearchaeota archaeon]
MEKERMQEIKGRLSAWWEGEKIEPPVMGYTCPRQDITKVIHLDDWYLARNPDDFLSHVHAFKNYIKNTCFKGDIIPRININYGPGILAAIFGCEPVFKKGTVWFDHPTAPDNIIDLLENAKINSNNKWYSRIINATKTAAEVANGLFAVGVTDLGGILDVLVSFVGYKNLVLMMKKKPAVIDTCRTIIIEKWHLIYDEVMKILDKMSLGCSTWLNVWCPKHWYPIQCDLSAALSPALFKRFVLPDLIFQSEKLDYCIYHLDGPNQIPYVDDILKIDGLTGIQWVPGILEPRAGHDKWIPLLKKIQKAGKNVIIDPSPQFITKVYHELEARKLFVSTSFPSRIFADFYLPAFAGGMEGIDPEES